MGPQSLQMNVSNYSRYESLKEQRQLTPIGVAAGRRWVPRGPSNPSHPVPLSRSSYTPLFIPDGTEIPTCALPNYFHFHLENLPRETGK